MCISNSSLESGFCIKCFISRAVAKGHRGKDAIGMTYVTKTDKYKHELAGRIELGRDGLAYSALASHYGCCTDHIAKLRKKSKDNFDDFRLNAIIAAEKYYEVNGIEVSAKSLRAYLERRRLPDYGEVVSAVRAHEEKVHGVLHKFEGVPIQFQRAKNIIAATIRLLALKPINASSVAAALDEMGKAMDQLDPSSSSDQIGMAPGNICNNFSPLLKYSEF